MAQKPVFFDASGRRSARLTLAGWIAGIFSVIIAAAFVASLAVVPRLADVNMPVRLTALHTPNLENKAAAPRLLKQAATLAIEVRERQEKLARNRIAQNAQLGQAGLAPSQKPLSIAFYASWSPDSFDALKRALPRLDWVAPTWLNLSGNDMAMTSSFDQKVLDYIRKTKPGVALLPVIQNVNQGKFDGVALANLLADADKRHDLTDKIVAFMTLHRLQGIIVDFEDIQPQSHGDLTQFLRELKQAFRPKGWIIGMAAPLDDDSWPFAAYAPFIDYTMLMAYDEHSQVDSPGSLASQVWFERNLDARMRQLPPEKTIICIGNYAYDWTDNQFSDVLSFESAVVAARESKANIAFDETTNNPHFSYMENNVRHDVWFLDGVTAFNQIHMADGYRPRGYALWRLGAEDGSIWSVMDRPYDAPAPDGLKKIRNNEEIEYQGVGEVLRVQAGPSQGERRFTVEKDNGDIVDESYVSLPSGYVIRFYGKVDKELAITFDDGPDAEWTPQILDILKSRKVPATFFIIGNNAEANPEIVQRMLAEGHEIGNHTFTHPILSETPEQATKLELNANQRLFQAITGRSMRLFRPPYISDAQPNDIEEIIPVEIAQNLGYITVGQHIDPDDRKRPGVQAIIDRTIQQVHSTKAEDQGSVILFHDSGGDRSETVAALPFIIDKLRAQGYRFVLASKLAGLTRDQAMPRLQPDMILLTDRAVFLTLGFMGQFLYVCFLIAIVLGVARLIFLGILSGWNRRKENRTPEPALGSASTVSVIIPAYNEEKVIVRTVEWILQSDYPDLEIVVVNDGSQDQTAKVLADNFATNPRVALINIPNGGKANAVNIGLKQSRGDIVVALDADTHFNSDTISRLVRWFDDPEVGAVAGNAKVGNRINMVTRWQALEYIVAQNLERRALAALDTLTVVPGAVGAWRRSALLELGGFPADTLAEDQDLTIGLQKAGYRVLFDSSAIAWTEAPATFRALAKQRFRWSYGTLQCLWKYRAVTFNRRYGALGMVALPQVWLFQIVLTALAPLADLMFLWQLFTQGLSYLQHGDQFNSEGLMLIALYYVVFIVVDVLAAVIGFASERDENWKILWLLPLQRFGYRQLMYYVVVRSLFTALRGPFVGWGKLERSGLMTAKRT
jgi:cellulose synthase/poly-beta-1,6-N-acetylglucosamine synthase-like glycosyltransferase/peptidoglycan/xylan/chitin deacetylase (PgdA/CDA1 family)/spore germination protein YaaH